MRPNELAGDEQNQIIDVRGAHEWEAGRLEHSKNIPLDELEDRIGEIDAARKVVTVCRSGSRSSKAAQMLAGKGLKAQNLQGGLIDWVKGGGRLVAADGSEGKIAGPPRPDDLKPELADFRDNVIEIALAIQQRFGDRDPSDQETRDFMREWLLSKGRTPEEADHLLDKD